VTQREAAAAPDVLVLVRHAQSVANVANANALAGGAATIAVDGPDRDVALSPLGEAQARRLGERIAGWPPMTTAFVSSPYRRCTETARIARDAGGIAGPILTDERLHERALGILDKLTPAGVVQRFPEEAARRRTIGKYAYRPPEGESWADVVDRLRPFVRDVQSGRFEAQRVFVVTHQALVLCLRSILEPLTETQLLQIDGAAEVANGATAVYRRFGPLYRFERCDA
jgi:broad specificity phosphatase PhoE